MIDGGVATCIGESDYFPWDHATKFSAAGMDETCYMGGTFVPTPSWRGRADLRVRRRNRFAT